MGAEAARPALPRKPAEQRAAIALPPVLPAPPAPPGMHESWTTRANQSSVRGAARVEARRLPAITTLRLAANTTLPNHPVAHGAGPRRRPTRSCVANRPGKPLASHAPAAVPTSGPRRAAAVSMVTTGMTRPARLSTWADTKAATRPTSPMSRPTSRGADGPRQTATTGRITPSRRSATAAGMPRTSLELSRAPSAGAAHGHMASLRGGRRLNRGSTTAKSRPAAGREAVSPPPEATKIR
jgi:hypothetical protein